MEMYMYIIIYIYPSTTYMDTNHHVSPATMHLADNQL